MINIGDLTGNPTVLPKIEILFNPSLNLTADENGKLYSLFTPCPVPIKKTKISTTQK